MRSGAGSAESKTDTHDESRRA